MIKTAPVIITTLNRKNHLKRCIDSLRDNTLANETDLFISVDFPPSDKYVEGYEEVKAYLGKGIAGFRKVTIIYQEHNIGPQNNMEFLIDQVRGTYDVFIMSEDDNEFSPNFLDFINKGIAKYNDDESVYIITGFNEDRHADYLGQSVGFDHDLAPLGAACWHDKYDRLMAKINRKNFISYIKDNKKSKLLYKEFGNRFWQLVEAVIADPEDETDIFIHEGDISHIDYTVGVVMVCENLYCVRPNLSLVRNWGYDGTGVHCSTDGGNYSGRAISHDTRFEFEVDECLSRAMTVTKILPDKRAKRARWLRRVYLVFGARAARKIKIIWDKLDYKISLKKDR